MFMFNYYINFHVSASNIAPAILIQHNIGFSSSKKRESGVSRECVILLPYPSGQRCLTIAPGFMRLWIWREG